MKADPEVLHQAVAVIDSVLADLDAGRISGDTAAKTIGLKVLTAREVVLEALRAPQNDGAAAMREACLKAALGACYGPPSSWPGDYPKGWRHPPAWGPDEKLTPTLAAWHDNGARDAWSAIRALAQPDPSQEPGTGGEE